MHTSQMSNNENLCSSKDDSMQLPMIVFRDLGLFPQRKGVANDSPLFVEVPLWFVLQYMIDINKTKVIYCVCIIIYFKWKIFL